MPIYSLLGESHVYPHFQNAVLGVDMERDGQAPVTSFKCEWLSGSQHVIAGEVSVSESKKVTLWLVGWWGGFEGGKHGC